MLNTSKTIKPAKPYFRPGLKRGLSGLLVLLVISGLCYWLSPRPELKTFTSYSTAFLDDKGSLMRITLAHDERYRIYQKLSDISPRFIKATLYYEDQNYYQHFGVDPLALFRAFWETFILGERRIGASTIVMQVARLRWQIPSHTFSGKIEQIIRALQLARHYSKQDILEAYFNMVPYGGNIEGIGAASLIYFNKHPAELSLLEALTLAVIPQNPNKRDPTRADGLKNLLAARSILFARWVEENPQDQSLEKFLALPLSVRSRNDLPRVAPHFTQHLINHQSLWDHGIVNTTLSTNQQHQLESVVASYLSSKADIGFKNAAALLLNYQTMEIEAMLGSADFYAEDIHGQVNGTTAKRSPGSTLKPFVYGLAIDEGLIHPLTLLKDSPHRYGGFSPENYDKKFLGPIVAKEALIQSRNLPAVILQSQLQQRSFYDFLKQAGITELKDESFYGLALALGGGELTMMELVKLYSLLANQGNLKTIKMIRTDQKPEHQTENTPQLLSAEASYLILDMLKDNPAPNALSLNTDYLHKNQVAWKTGTSWAFRDAWAIGISGPYVLAVWIGNFDGQGNNAFIGRSAAGPLLFKLFDSLLATQNWQVESLADWQALNIKPVKVCGNTGDLNEKFCPVTQETWFIPGISPIKISNIYRQIPIRRSSGLRTCDSHNEDIEYQVFEFWPSDFLSIFNQAGISLKKPPAYEPHCTLQQKSHAGQQPMITSPQTRLDYVIQSENADLKHIPFSAVVDPDVEEIFWFVNGKYAGSAKRDESFIWNAANGNFMIRAVDDSGRAASQRINVIQVQ